MLIKAMAGEFDLRRYHDDYREALERLIEAKIAGKVIPQVEAPAPVGDVADALLRSLNMLGVKA